MQVSGIEEKAESSQKYETNCKVLADRKAPGILVNIVECDSMSLSKAKCQKRPFLVTHYLSDLDVSPMAACSQVARN